MSETVEKEFNVSYSTVMVGCSLMGGFVHMENLPALLMGTLDFELSAFFYQREFGKLPEKHEDLKEAKVVEMLDKVKNYYRSSLQNAFTTQARNEQYQEEMQKRTQKAQAVRNFRDMNRPAPEGTVDELATRYGVSKSAIRTLKREGRLHELTQPA